MGSSQSCYSTGQGRARPPTLSNPQSKVEDLVEQFAVQASGECLSPKVKELQQSLLPIREGHIQEALNTADVNDRPYNMTELLNTLKDSRDTAPCSDQIKQCLLNHMGHYSCVWVIQPDTSAAPIWRQAEIIPIPKPQTGSY